MSHRSSEPLYVLELVPERLLQRVEALIISDMVGDDGQDKGKLRHVGKDARLPECLTRNFGRYFALHVSHASHFLQQDFEVGDFLPVLLLDSRLVRDQVTQFLVRAKHFLVHRIARVRKICRTNAKVHNRRITLGAISL